MFKKYALLAIMPLILLATSSRAMNNTLVTTAEMKKHLEELPSNEIQAWWFAQTKRKFLSYQQHTDFKNRKTGEQQKIRNCFTTAKKAHEALDHKFSFICLGGILPGIAGTFLFGSITMLSALWPRIPRPTTKIAGLLTAFSALYSAFSFQKLYRTFIKPMKNNNSPFKPIWDPVIQALQTAELKDVDSTNHKTAPSKIEASDDKNSKL